MKTPNALKDALYNTSCREIRDEQGIIYARGMIVGVVATLMLNMSFKVALRNLVENLPQDFSTEALPSAWVSEIFEEAKRQGKWNPKINGQIIFRD